MTRCHLAVLASHPIQYFTPIYRRLARLPEIELEVMYYRDFGVRERFDEQFGRAIAWDTDQLSGYRSRFLANVSPISSTFNPLYAINPGAFVRLLHGFDAIWLNGYMYPSNWFAAAAAHLRKTAILLRSELRLASDRNHRWTDTVREHVIRGWVRRSDALLYIGEGNRQAYLHYGAATDKLFFCPYACDNEAMQAARRRADQDRTAARHRLNIPPDKTIVLFVGKLTPRKHPEAAVDIAADPELRDLVHVVIAGSGPLDDSLRERVRSLGTGNVSFLGFVNQSALPDVYAVGDVFLMPSEREPWGLVLNEAMAAGVVPVVSDAVGACADLIVPGQTGLAFPSRDWRAMRDAVARVVKDVELRDRLSSGAAQRVEAYGYDEATAGVVQALAALGLISGAPPSAPLEVGAGNSM